jgi:CRP-like cAMP-binding protein
MIHSLCGNETMIEAVSVTKKLRKPQYLLQEGDVCRHNAFIAKGCLRSYRVGNDGTEHILRFAIENWWTSDRESFTTGLPSKNNIDALEDSDVVLWTKENFEILKEKIPRLRAFYENLLAKII